MGKHRFLLLINYLTLRKSKLNGSIYFLFIYLLLHLFIYKYTRDMNNNFISIIFFISNRRTSLVLWLPLPCRPRCQSHRFPLHNLTVPGCELSWRLILAGIGHTICPRFPSYHFQNLRASFWTSDCLGVTISSCLEAFHHEPLLLWVHFLAFFWFTSSWSLFIFRVFVQWLLDWWFFNGFFKIWFGCSWLNLRFFTKLFNLKESSL